MNILYASHIKPVQATGVKLMREVAFDSFAALSLQPLATITLNAPPVRVHGYLLSLFAMPVTRTTIRMSYVSPHVQFLQAHGNVVTVITLVRRHSNAAARSGAEEIATACMAQLLGMGLLLNSTDHANSPFEPVRDRTESWAIAALTNLADAKTDYGSR